MKVLKSSVRLAIFCLFFTAAAFAAEDQTKPQGQEQTKVIPEVTVRDIIKKPERFAGQDVMVTGKISRIEGANAFILEGSGLLNNKILVILAKPKSTASNQQPGTAGTVIKEKEKVQLIGKVEDIGITRIEEKYQPGLKAEVKAEFEGTMPVLVVPPNEIKVMK